MEMLSEATARGQKMDELDVPWVDAVACILGCGSTNIATNDDPRGLFHTECFPGSGIPPSYEY